MPNTAWTRRGGSEERRASVRALFLIVISVLFVTLPALTTVGAAATNSDAADEAATTGFVAASLSFELDDLSFEQHEGYDLVTLDGAHYTTTPADPMLPLLSIQLLLPPDTEPSDISCVYGGTIYIPGDYSILPAPRPTRFSSDAAANIPHPNTETYSSVLPYPRSVARLAGGGSTGGYRMASIAVTPLQYIPATGELLLHTNVEITVETKLAERAPAAQTLSSSAGAALASSAINPEAVSDYMNVGSRGRGSAEYLIICPESMTAAFEPLAEWKTRKGVPAEIITLEEIYSTPLYNGRDEAEEIRKCIADRYAGGTEWVLLGGDTDILPARDAYDFFYDQGIPCDLYYADLDRSWNEDADSRWGEEGSDNIDMFTDVFVGRAPVKNSAEASIFVDKVLEYEGASFTVAGDYESDILFLGEILWDDPDPYSDGGVALDMIDSNHIPTDHDAVTKLYERDGTLSHGAAMSALETGYGIVVHEGHANISNASIGSSSLTMSDLDGLTNGERGGLWYSVGCWSAAIDYDTFGEHWLTNGNGGGVAYVGNSRYGWGCPGYPGECVSDLFSQRFFESLFEKDLVHAGIVHADAKHNFVGIARTDDYTRYAMYELNLLGDPELPIWTESPELVTVTHDDAVSFDGSRAEFSVEVTVAGSPVEDATVCLMTEGENDAIYTVVETDAAGRAVISIDESEPSEALLTVTAHNCIPYGATITLGGATDVDDDVFAAGRTELQQNYPNPFNPRTRIAFSLGTSERARVEVYDVAGRLVSVLVDEELEAGEHSAEWNGTDSSGNDVASGTYFVRMLTGGSVAERKMVLMR